MENKLYDFGMIGLGVMGNNLLLNMADHGFHVVGYDKDIEKVNTLKEIAGSNEAIRAESNLSTMVSLLQPPRKIMLLVPAGKPVDDVIESLLPLLQKNDIIIDAGNSHYTDTLRRVAYLKEKNIHFMGMGVSGGEHGARTGPSIMPGGDKEAFMQVQPVLEAIAAKVNNEPCTAYMGNNAAGHYVKMVHNGIEYAMMQLISEVFDFLKNALHLTYDELHEVFLKWNEGKLQSFLIEITRDIFLKQDTETAHRLLEIISDKAGSKGTGKWTSQDAMELPVSIPTIDMAVSFRTLSGYKEERVQAAQLYHSKIIAATTSKQQLIQEAEDALYFAFIIAYTQGLAMLYQASSILNMNIPLKSVVKIWRGGCIIRSSLLTEFYKAFEQTADLPNVLLHSSIQQLIQSHEQGCRNFIVHAVQSHISVGGFSSALAYFDAYTREIMPTNLIQAQRDYFGAHTYQRIDKPGTFHTNWQEEK